MVAINETPADAWSYFLTGLWLGLMFGIGLGCLLASWWRAEESTRGEEDDMKGGEP